MISSNRVWTLANVNSFDQQEKVHQAVLGFIFLLIALNFYWLFLNIEYTQQCCVLLHNIVHAVFPAEIILHSALSLTRSLFAYLPSVTDTKLYGSVCPSHADTCKLSTYFPCDSCFLCPSPCMSLRPAGYNFTRTNFKGPVFPPPTVSQIHTHLTNC